jgi:hypothetical protein
MTGDTLLVDRIREAIDPFDLDLARVLLREALRNPTAEIYYLAYLVALDDRQRITFLSKSLELDPTYPPALDAIRKMQARREPFKVEAAPVVDISDIADIGQPAPIAPAVKQPTPVQVQQVLPQNPPVSPPVNVAMQSPPQQSPQAPTQLQAAPVQAGGAPVTPIPDNITEHRLNHQWLFVPGWLRTDPGKE